MGVFSWLDCESKKPVKIGAGPVYVLIPEAFGGGHIKENCYQGYGNFCGCDIFELVAEWNRKAINPEKIKLSTFEEPLTVDDFGGLWDFEKDKLAKEGKTPEEIEALDNETRARNYKAYVERMARKRADLVRYCGLDDEEAEALAESGDEVAREVGILLTCTNKDNRRLPYPIKITRNPAAVYEACKYSKIDPLQGCD